MNRSAFFAHVLTLLVCCSVSHAQTYTPIEGGDYACITFPDGSVKLGKANADGYSLISEKKVEANLNKRLELIRSKTQRLLDLKNEIRSDGAQPTRDLASGLKAFVQVFRGEEIDKDIVKQYKSKQEQLTWINELISRLKEEQKSVRYQLKVSKTCDVKSEPPPEGSLKVEYVNAPNGVAAVLYGKEGKFYTVNNYCVRGADKAISVYNFRTSPCPTMECSRPGYLGILLYSYSADHVISQDERAAFAADVHEHASGSYEVKIQKADKNYNLIPCEQILN